MIATANNTKSTAKLPKGWKWVKLGEVCEINPRRPEIDRKDDEPTSFVPMDAVNAQTGTIPASRLRPYGEIKKGYTCFSEGDVLFAKITPCMQNGKHTIAIGLIDGIGFGTTEFHVIRPGPEVTPQWIHSFLRQPSFLQKATEHFTGAVGQQRLPPDYLKALEIPLPPLPEQKRIAAMLNEQMAAVERARKAAAERRAAVNSLPSAYLRAVFPSTDETLPKGWRWVKLGEVCERRTGVRNPRTEPDAEFQYVDISSVDTVRKRIVEARALMGKDAPSRARQVILENDVIVSTTRPNLNAVALVPPKLNNHICSTGFCVLRATERIAPDFLFSFVRHESFVDALSDLVKGALYPAVNDKQVKAQIIPLPPLPEQKRIAAMLNEQTAAVEQARKSAEEELETINRLPAALLRRAFAGKL